jgi:zinc transport system substrate-binding protein
MKYLLLSLAAALIFWSCRDHQKIEKDTLENVAKAQVSVSILPQQYFVKRVIGDRYLINVMVPPGHSPATFAPTPQEIKSVSQSILYFKIGYIGFEHAWMEKISSLNPKMLIIDTSKGITLISGGEDHIHGEGDSTDHDHEGHSHQGIDPHIWLSPSAVKIQAKNILDAFMVIDSENGDIYQKNYSAFVQDIDSLQEETKLSLEPLKGKKFMVYHPAWSYFAREYGLQQFPIEIGGKSPGAADLKRVIDRAIAEKIGVIFVQKQFDSTSAQVVAQEIRGKVIQLDPLDPDWLGNMKKMIKAIKESFTF